MVGLCVIATSAFILVGGWSLLLGSNVLPAIGHGYLALIAAWLVTVLLTEVRRKS